MLRVRKKKVSLLTRKGVTLRDLSNPLARNLPFKLLPLVNSCQDGDGKIDPLLPLFLLSIHFFSISCPFCCDAIALVQGRDVSSRAFSSYAALVREEQQVHMILTHCTFKSIFFHKPNPIAMLFRIVKLLRKIRRKFK